MSVEIFIRTDILTTAKKTLQLCSQHDGQFKNNYQPQDKGSQGNEVSPKSLPPEDGI